MSEEQELINELQEYLDIEDTDNIALYPEEVQMCMDALEKQAAKKVIVRDIGVDIYDCPSCEKVYLGCGGVYNYCPDCGQKLDWSEVE